MSGGGKVPLQVPRVRDRSVTSDSSKIKFRSSLVPPYLRKAKSLKALRPWLYLKGISTGDFSEALAALPGPDSDPVKFRMSDFRAENGTKTVYAKPTRKAKSSCKSDPLALDYLDQTVDECAADLVEQLIRSAELEQLTAYHRSRTGSIKTIKPASRTQQP